MYSSILVSPQKNENRSSYVSDFMELCILFYSPIPFVGFVFPVVTNWMERTVCNVRNCTHWLMCYLCVSLFILFYFIIIFAFFIPFRLRNSLVFVYMESVGRICNYYFAHCFCFFFYFMTCFIFSATITFIFVLL